MRTEIRQELQAGLTPDQVRSRFVASYGQWILLSPPKQGPTLLAWLLAPIVVIGGGVAAAVVIRRWTLPTRLPAAQPERALSEDERQLLARELAGVDDERWST
jgi:cytochrome c-type biogenesis protein CcmH